MHEIPEKQAWTYDRIKEAFYATPHTICQIAKRFVTSGQEFAGITKIDQSDKSRATVDVSYGKRKSVIFAYTIYTNGTISRD